MALYKQSVAYNRHFFMVSSTDHLSAKTGLTPTVNISKAGAAFGAAAGAVTEIANGWYRVALTTADTGTTGDLMFHITGTAADDTDFADQIVAYDPFDAAALGLSRLDAAITSRMATFTLPTNFSSLVIDANGRVDLSKWLGSAVNALIAGRVDANAQVVGDKSGYSLTQAFPTNFSSLSITAAGLVDITQAAADKVWSTTTRALTDKVGFALSAAGIQAIWDALTSALTTAGSIGKRLADFITGDAYVRLGAPAGASVSADIAAVKTDTAAIKTKTDQLTFTVANRVDSQVKGMDADTVDAVALKTDAVTEIADGLLDRNMATGTDSGSASVRTVRQSLRTLRNKVDTVAGTVYKEDDTTSSWTFTPTTDPTANPITIVDPA